MEFPVILGQPLAFSEGEMEGNYSVRKASAILGNFPNFGTGIKVCEDEWGDGSGGDPTNESPGKPLTVKLGYSFQFEEGCLTIWTTKSNTDHYAELKKALGGKLLVGIRFELETASVTLNEVEMFKRNDRQVPSPKGMVFLLSQRFHFTDSLSEAWRDNGNTFTGRLSVNLRLNDNHLGEILRYGHGENQNPLVVVNKRMQMDTKFMDVTLVPSNGKEVKCHKIVLIANSDYFKNMFESEMKEVLTGTVDIPDMSFEGVQALLDYFYCKETTKASNSASVALELLKKADEYSIESLEKAMLQLIHVKDNDWFSVDVALRLLQFAKNKFENEGLLIYQLVKHKAGVVLKSKSKEEVEQSKEFQEFFRNDQTQMDLFTYCMFDID